MAEYSQSIESTDDTGRTLVLRDFVEVNTSNKKKLQIISTLTVTTLFTIDMLPFAKFF